MRRVLLLAPIAAVLVGVAVVGATGQDLTPVPSTEILATSNPALVHGYLVSFEEVRERRDLAAKGIRPYEESVADLVAWAGGALDDPSTPVQPLVADGTANPFVDDARRAYGLGLAFALTGDERFADAARRTIRAWVDVSVASADTCPDSGGCHTSLIIGRVGAGFVFGADLIAGSTSWTAEDRDKLSAWLRNVLIPGVSHRPNNWGDAGTFLRVVATDYIGDREGFDDAIVKWRSLIDLIDADGRIPEEVRRGSAGMLYTQEALQYKIAVARIAERRGINLWDYKGSAGGSLRAAMDRLAYYWGRPQDWPDHPRVDVPTAGPVWELAYAHWQEAAWVPMVLENRPYGDRGHSAIRWTTLTNGVPIEPQVATGPSPSPAPSASATPSATPIASAPVASPPPSSAPVAGPPVLGVTARLGSPLGGSIPVTFTWNAGASGTKFRLERSTEGGAWRGVALDSNRHSATESLRPGTNYAYRVRATRAGRTGVWAVLNGVRAIRIEPSGRTTDLSGGWSSVPFGSYSNDVALSTDQSGATVTWRGPVRSVAVVGPIGPTRGQMTLSADGSRKKSVDLYASEFKARNVLAVVRLGPGEHAVRIAASGSGSRRTVAIDDIVILQWKLSA